MHVVSTEVKVLTLCVYAWHVYVCMWSTCKCACILCSSLYLQHDMICAYAWYINKCMCRICTCVCIQYASNSEPIHYLYSCCYMYMHTCLLYVFNPQFIRLLQFFLNFAINLAILPQHACEYADTATWLWAYFCQHQFSPAKLPPHIRQFIYMHYMQYMHTRIHVCTHTCAYMHGF